MHWEDTLSPPSSVLICACGPSVQDVLDLVWGPVSSRPRVLVVNYAARWVPLEEIDYLVTCDPIERFSHRNAVAIGQAAAVATYTFHAMGLDIPNVVDSVKVDTCASDMIDEPGKIAAATSSTFVAAAIAYRLGAQRIGVIGHDLIGHRVLSHPDHTAAERAAWSGLHARLAVKGVELRNLSAISKVDTFPHQPLEAWLRGFG